MLKLLAYILLTFSLLLAVLLPTYFQAVGSYASPTATYAHVLTNAMVVPTKGDYWSHALVAEIEYPAPSILLAVYSKISGFPEELKMYQPTAGLASLVYFVLMMKAASLGRIKREHAILLASIYYLFIVSDRLIAHYIGRAAFGVIALAYFFLALLMYMNYVDDRRREGLISLTLLATLSGFTYYTSALATFLVCLFLYPLTRLVNLNKHESRRIRYRDLLIISLLTTVLAIVRVISTSELLADLSLTKFYGNLFEYIKAQLKIEKTSEAYFLHVGFGGEMNPIIRVTQLWLRTSIKLLAAAALSLSFSTKFIKLLLKRKRKTSADINHLDAYAIAAFLCCCAELAYTFLAPTFSLRFFTIFGLPMLIYVAYRAATSKTIITNLRSRICRVASLMLLGLVLIVSVSSTALVWHEEIEHVKVYGYEKVQGVAEYLMTANPSDSTSSEVRIAGDAYYSAILYYLLRIRGSNTVAEPLGPLSITLYYACYNVTYHDELIRQLSSKWLLLLQGETTFGDAWGYAAKIQRCDHILSIFNYSIYSDMRFALLAR